MDEIDRKERQKELELQTKKIAQKTLLIEEVERMKEIKTQKRLNNYDEERRMYENELFMKKESELRERREKEMKLKLTLENKE